MESLNIQPLGAFLSTFDEPEAPQTPAPESTKAPVQTEAQVPVSALPAILEAANKASHAAANPAPAAPVVEPPRVEKPKKRKLEEDDPEAVARRLAVAEQEIANLRLENYRANCINNARIQGRRFVDALVWGQTPEEIETSLVVAEQEYNLIKAQVLNETLTQAREAQAVAPPPAPAVPPPAPQLELEPPAPPPSVPTFHSPSAAAAVTGDEGVLAPEQVAYLTSPEALRNGDFLKYRHTLHQAIRQGMPRGPGKQWSLHQAEAYSLAPPLPQSMAPGAPSYSSVQLPQVRLTQPAGGAVRSAPVMQTLGRPALPNETNVAVPVDAAAANRAAQQAIAVARSKPGGQAA